MNKLNTNKKLILFKAKVKDTLRNYDLGYCPNSWICGSLVGIDLYNGPSVAYIVPLGEHIYHAYDHLDDMTVVEVIPETICEFTGWIVSQDIYSGPDEDMNRIPLVDQLFDVTKNNDIDILSKIHINKNTGIVTAKFTEPKMVDFLRKDRFNKNQYINNITLEFIFTNDILKSDYGIAIVKYGHFCNTDFYDAFNDPCEIKGYYLEYFKLAEDNQLGEQGAQSSIYPYTFDYFTIIDNDFNKKEETSNV